jgi:CMP-N-acetylneuraminic acid synthetase
MPNPVITVYTASQNYGHFLEEAIESVVAQTRQDWELFIFDLGSTDETAAVAARFQAQDPERISTVTYTEPKRLQIVANEAIRRARGQYVIRLDADDWFDENALLVLAHYLDTHADVAMVAPNYVYVDERGAHLSVENRRRTGDVTLLDLPAHGACTMVRKRILKAVGGYDETNDRQDGYELWLKVVNRYKVGDVPTPLFYYRQHGQSLSSDRTELLKARARIKRKLVERTAGTVRPRAVAVIGAKNTYPHLPNVVLTPVADKPLIDYTIDEAIASGVFEKILVSTDDPAVVEYCSKSHPDVLAYVRPLALSSVGVTGNAVLNDALNYLEQESDIWPDVIFSLSIHAPLRKAEHVQKALDTLLLYDVDSVVSVCEDQELYYNHGERGLMPINPSMHRQIRLEREALYMDNGAVHVMWRDALIGEERTERTVGHIVMPRWDSLQIKTPQDAWLIEQVLLERQRGLPLAPRAWALKTERA